MIIMPMIYWWIGLRMNDGLLLLKEIYSIDRIRQTCNAFSDLAEITVTDSNKYWKCEFAECRFDYKKTICEFENYLIGVSNKEG